MVVAGISEHIREAYSFICTNYSRGDEIFLIGFSRGAFTARSISSLIRAVGLLTPAGLVHFYQIFQDWEFQLKDGWTSPYPTQPWPHRPRCDTPEYRRKLLELELTRPDIPIKAVAVWDTVGSLGIPMIGLFPQPPSTDYAFVDTKVEPNIENAFQALALDEHRRAFTPTIWEKPAEQAWPLVLKQCWFPGVHADIGGGYHNADLANITLAWMISQLDPFLSFDHSYIIHENRLSLERQAARGHPKREWGAGRIHDSMTLFFRLGGSQIRTPSQHHHADRRSTTNQKSPPTTCRHRLLHTNESIHSSVRIRMGRNGLGYNDKGKYDSEALQGWTMNGTEVSPSTARLNDLPYAEAVGKMANVRWIKPLLPVAAGNNKEPLDELELELVMPEDAIGTLEREIMGSWPDVYEGFETIRPGGHAANVRRSSTYPNEHPRSQTGALLEGEVVDGARHDRVETF